MAIFLRDRYFATTAPASPPCAQKHHHSSGIGQAASIVIEEARTQLGGYTAQPTNMSAFNVQVPVVLRYLDVHDWWHVDLAIGQPCKGILDGRATASWSTEIQVRKSASVSTMIFISMFLLKFVRFNPIMGNNDFQSLLYRSSFSEIIHQRERPRDQVWRSSPVYIYQPVCCPSNPRYRERKSRFFVKQLHPFILSAIAMMSFVSNAVRGTMLDSSMYSSGL